MLRNTDQRGSGGDVAGRQHFGAHLRVHQDTAAVQLATMLSQPRDQRGGGLAAVRHIVFCPRRNTASQAQTLAFI
eukprot:scaffold1340_cov253-Pinguiococcus_pyrenoidosus.AAC.30